jgi:hypothetical protein
MSANKIAETSTSTGTGNITLAGAWSVPSSFVTGNRTFNSFYGLNHRFPYFIQDQLGNWEKGRGFLSASTTLVRETVIDNSLNTTALINFPAGDKLVMVPTDAGLFWPETLDSGNFMLSASVYGFSSTGSAFTANNVRLSPYLLMRPMIVTGCTFEVQNSAAASSLKPLIYKARNYLTSGTTLDLIAIGSVADSSTTGVKNSTISATLGQGLYMVGFVANGNPQVRANGAGSMYVGFQAGAGINGNVPGTVEFSGAGFYDTPPTTRTGSLGEQLQSLRVGLLGRLL